MPLTANHHAHIDRVLARFDLDKLERVLHAERWKWTTAAAMEVPDARRILDTAMATLQGAILYATEAPEHAACSGGSGFETVAELTPGSLDIVRLELRFVLLAASSHSPDEPQDN